jgi:nicotinamidase-related amidase
LRPASGGSAGAESLIIFGESTSGCVRASTVDAYSYGFHNVVVEECTYDRSLLSHKVNLFDCITNMPTSCTSTR